MQGREHEYGGICQVPCEKVQKLSELVAEMKPNLDIAIEGVANFRAFQGDVREFIARQDERSDTVAGHLKTQAEQDTTRRKNSQWRMGIMGIGILALLGFLGQKAWDQMVMLNRLEDDWQRYYQTLPPNDPKVHNKSYFDHRQSGVRLGQEPAQNADTERTSQ